MTLRVERGQLVAALSTAVKAVETRNTIPILANVLLSTSDGTLTLRTSDLDVQITTSLPASGDLAPDGITVPAKTLLDIARKFPAGAEVLIVLDGPNMIVKSGRSRFKLGTLPADSFPSLDVDNIAAAFEADLGALFKSIAFAISDEETRYWLCGIYLLGRDGALTAVATDGHRLARHVAELDAEFNGVIIPKKTVGILPAGPVKVEVGANRVRFTQGDVEIVSKLIEGTYPDYERVIPRDEGIRVSIDSSLLAAAVDRVSVVDGLTKIVKFDITEDTVSLTLSGNHDTATDEVPAEASEAATLGTNARYVLDMLGAMGSGLVSLTFRDGNSPILVRGANDNWTCVQMPVRVA